MRIACEVAFVDLQGEHTMVPSVEVTCRRCGNTAESFGTGSRSITRCMVLLRESCPKREDNFYYDEEEGDPGPGLVTGGPVAEIPF